MKRKTRTAPAAAAWGKPLAIERVETTVVRLPYDSGARQKGWLGRNWSTLDYVLVRIDTDAGITGWGDAFGYGATLATKAVIDHLLGPQLIGKDARDIAGLSRQMQRDNHIWGRYGITMFGLSGIDIALWDIAGKAAGLPLCRLLGGPARTEIEAYSSLFKYQDAERVAEKTGQSVAEGYRYVKLHETTLPEVRAARAAAPEAALMVDTNCPWTPEEAHAMAGRLRDCDLHWLEEPIFPPEDFAALARLRVQAGIPLAAGENACTAFEFKRMFEAGAVDYAQPSVTKVGGITEFRKIAALAEACDVTLVPHSPYFGPGFLATLHLLAALPVPTLAERFYCEVKESLYGDFINPVRARYRLPDGPGLGMDPDPAVIRRCRDKSS
ncbi:MAG: mandelate racemase/muconate lactonizing enzyme family protein [Alphaproteobacteria bacterium]|nr:mandelate racemase/muconate lactonizing enzyme family protein [Alphaproteobacteria bacterium]